MFRSHGRFALSLLVLIIASAMFAAVRPARAQGAGDSLPKPITTSELVRYIQQLNLSKQQQLAVTRMHDDYKRKYADLYESEIKPFLDEARVLSGGRMPQRDELQKVVRDMRTLEGRIRTLDNTLFDQIQPMLTEEQMIVMPRVRLARQRACYNQQNLLQMWTMGSPIIDVSATVQDLKLPAEEMALVDPALARYETNITGRMGRLHDNATSLWLDIFDAIETAGFNVDQFEDMSNVDPEELQRFIKFIQETYVAKAAKGREEVGRIHDSNRQTVRSFRGLVPDDTYRLIRNAYYIRAYPNVPAITMNAPTGVAALAEIKDLSPEKRAEAADAVNRAVTEIDQIVENVADAADEFRKSFNFIDFDNERYQKHNEAMQEFQKQATAVNQRLMDQLTAILTAEEMQQWQQRLALDTKRVSPHGETEVIARTEAAPTDSAGDDADADDEYEEQIDYSVDQFLPSRIAKRDLTVYQSLLGVTDEQQAIIKELYNSYAEKFTALEQGRLKELNDLRMKMWQMDDDGNRAITKEHIESSYVLRKELLSEIAALDNAFFDDVQLLLADDEVLKRFHRVRLLRERQSYNRPGVTMYGWGSGREDSASRIDVVEFLARQELDEETLASLDAMLSEYEKEIMPLVKQRYDDALNVQKQQEIWSMRWEEMQKDEGSAAAQAKLATEYEDTFGKARKQLAEIDEKVGALNTTTMETAIAKLPTSQAQDARDTYNRRAYPSVFRDPASVKKHIEKASELNDLTSEQQSSLADLRLDYQPAYDDVCQRMLKLTLDSPTRTLIENDDWAEYSKYQDDLQRLQFERTELNSRALLQLRTLLTDSQIEAIGGLPEVAKRNDDQATMW